MIKKPPNEKATKAYKLYDERKKPVEVAIELGLSEKEATRYYKEYWRLNHLYKLYQVYIEVEHSLPSFLKLHKALKKRGLNPNNVEWFADAIETGAIKIPEIQKQYAKIKDDIEAIDYKKTMAKYQLDEMNNQITYLNKISYNKRNEIAYLKIGVQELEGYVHGLNNHNQQQQEVQNE
jgi:predicted  nucleic acid-binding Zn-ribbon protein